MNREYYHQYYYYERSHWWFLARLTILEEVIRRNISGKNLRILNVGVATGATTQMLEKFGHVTSVEYDKECCEFLKDKTGIEAINASLTNLPFKNGAFDLVCAFDVIEHIENDGKALAEIKRVLSNRKNFLITVPAFQFLWSEHDEINHHFRRYKMSELSAKLRSNGLYINYKTYFNFLLFIPVLCIRILQKLIKKKDSNKKKSDFERMNSGFINSFMKKIFQIEKPLISRKLSFPFGVSILFFGEKISI
jgi:SAM-dependent methyltransferase